MHDRGNKGEEAPLAAETHRGGEREEINADCYSRNLMRSHLPGTWPALVCASLAVSSYSLCRNGRGCSARSLDFTNPLLEL